MQDENQQAPEGLPEGISTPTEPSAPPATEDVSDSGQEQTAESQDQTERQEETDQPDNADDSKDALSKEERENQRVQRRMDRLTRLRYDERRQREAVEAENQRLAAELDAFRRASRGQDGQQPTLDDVREQVRREERERIQLENRARQFNADCNRTYEIGTKEFPDFAETVRTLGDVGLLARQDIVQTILEAGDADAHKVLYALGKDPDLAEDFLSLSPIRMAAKVAKLSGQVPKPPPVSKAPPPVRPVNGASRSEGDPDKMSTDQWMKWAEKHLPLR